MTRTADRLCTRNTAGAPATMLAAPRLCCVRGEIVQIAMPKVPREMDIVALTFRELTLKGVRVYDAHDFERAIALASICRMRSRGISPALARITSS